MGHAMHTVRREEKRRSREEEGGGGAEEEDQGGGEEGADSRDKKGRNAERGEVKEKDEGQSAGRVRLRGGLLKTYVLSILIRTVMEASNTDITFSL